MTYCSSEGEIEEELEIVPVQVFQFCSRPYLLSAGIGVPQTRTEGTGEGMQGEIEDEITAYALENPGYTCPSEIPGPFIEWDDLESFEIQPYAASQIGVSQMDGYGIAYSALEEVLGGVEVCISVWKGGLA